MGRIIISWDYGIRLLDKDYLVSELIRLKDELANFNWDYMMRPNIYGEGMIKVTDPDKIDDRYDWLTKAIPELEKMCKERGIDVEKEASQMKLKMLAVRLNDFYKDFDFYDYVDSVEDTGNAESVVSCLVEQLNDSTAISGIINALKEIKEESELTAEQSLNLDALIEDVEAVCLSKPLDEVLTEAVGKSEDQRGKNDEMKDNKDRAEVEKE